MTNQSSYYAEIVGNHARGGRNLSFEIQAHALTALFCPFSTHTSNILEKLAVSQSAIYTDGERIDVNEVTLRRVSQQIYEDQSDEGVYRVLPSKSESKQLKALVPVDVWSNGVDGVGIYDRLDELDSFHLQVVLDAIRQEVEGSRPTSVIVTRRLEIAEVCGNIVYVENDRLYSKTLNQGRKSFVVHLEPDALVRKFYNDNGDKLTKSLREIGFYSHYAHAQAIPKLLQYREADQISIGYISGRSISEMSFADEKSKMDLTKRYANAVADLFGDLRPVSDELKLQYYNGVGAKANFETVMNGLNALAPHYVKCDRFQQLVSIVERFCVTNELLIKLDWNSSNVILSSDGQFRFIDFEQAFIGTAEMLTGILLHNPVWCARTLVQELRNQSLASLDDETLSVTVHFAFAAVLIDSVSRSGSPWSIDRFESAFERHVTERLVEIGG